MFEGYSKSHMKKICMLVSILFCLLGCSKDEIKVDKDNLLVGIWKSSGYNNGSDIYTRDDRFTDEHCYKFNDDGTLTERKNAGWCGTPPVTYADYAGSWTSLNDTLISISVGYWGGTTTYKLDIQSVDAETLKVDIVPEEE
jgi:hypothetical protein